MYPSVAKAFWSSVAGEEGVISWPYLDSKGLVTVGMGILEDDKTGQVPASMLALPWQIEAPGLGARRATNAEIAAGWQKVKAAQSKAGIGGGNDFWRNLTDLRLSQEAIQDATVQWLQHAEPILRQSFPNYDRLQADAQLALLGMSYAMGPAFAQSGYPKFKAAINAVVPDYDQASRECTINKSVDSAIADHNATNVQLFMNAEAAKHSTTPYDVLWWPGNIDPGTAYGQAAQSLAKEFQSLQRGVWARRLLVGAVATGVGFAGYEMVQARRRGESVLAPFERFGHRVDERFHKFMKLSP